MLRNISLTLSNYDSMEGLIRPPLLLACSVERPHLTNFTLSNIITYSVDSRSIFEFDVKRPPFSINLYAAAVSANHSTRAAEHFEKSYFSFVLSCSLHLDFSKNSMNAQKRDAIFMTRSGPSSTPRYIRGVKWATFSIYINAPTLRQTADCYDRLAGSV